MSFDDPVEDGRIWQVDVTFLLSSWDCIFGAGCQGVLTAPAPELVQGCCSYGAHFSDKADRLRTEKLAKRLPAELWQFANIGRKKGIAVRIGRHEGEPDWRTRLVDGACVFLNRPGWKSGPGCALHQWGMRTNTHHSELKPEVCWQLPLRRVDEVQADGSVISTLTEFGRDGWGEGGEEFCWWCTEAPEAFVGTRPVYQSLEPELRLMLGSRLYTKVAAYLDARRESSPPPVVHVAEVKLLKRKRKAGLEPSATRGGPRRRRGTPRP